VDLADPARSYWNKDWYRGAVAAGAPIWTEPYYDEGAGNLQMVTYAVPFFSAGAGERKTAGVVTADLALGFLKRSAESNQIGRNGFIIIFSGSGRIVTHPETKHILRDSLASLARQYACPEFDRVQAEVAAGRGGSLRIGAAGFRRSAYACYQPIRVGGWGVMVGFDEEEFLAPVNTAGQVALGSALAALVALAVIIVLLSRRITRPLVTLARTAEVMAHGNLDVAIEPPRSRDEVGQLAAAFIHMRDDLRRYVAELAATTAARQKIESELAIALQIQRAMLPATRCRLAGARSLEIAAHLQPAKTVGGDLYTYFQPAPARLCFAIGDVSDKGVPAALFMARTITLLKTLVREAVGPADLLRRVNAELYPENEECMFVTLFFGTLDLETGALVFANAGHEPPLRLATDGTVQELNLPAGPALGLQPDVVLPDNRVTLARGETLLLYTDGVTDAADRTGRVFTRERLLQAVAVVRPDANAHTQTLRQQVEAFVAGAAQVDDITIFALTLS
jgi:sigma-B regulation protein RsbU (phosphoserine phosphatase)